ncbi:MAG TPA: hypothetical protein VE844_15630 [Gammaproteobacteria bacterium]|nr:hypothetical protein [Gammaproteobacteria bacterium]
MDTLSTQYRPREVSETLKELNKVAHYIHDDVVNAYVALTEITLLSSDRVRKAAESKAAENLASASNSI